MLHFKILTSDHANSFTFFMDFNNATKWNNTITYNNTHYYTIITVGFPTKPDTEIHDLLIIETTITK